jgi:hypothetical protein
MSDKYLLPKIPKNILPFLVVCEGISDARFVCELLELKKISTCSVGCPSNDGLGGAGGVQAIPRYLLGIQAIIKGKQTLSGILVMVDADDKPAQRFQTMRKALTDAEFPAPEKPFTITIAPPRTAIFLIPKEGENGTLDSLLLEAALKHRPQMRVCLDNFCDCMGNIKSWTQNQQSKMRLSAVVAASCQENPWATGAIMWSEKGCPVPINSDCSVHVSDFLAAFVSMGD